MRRHFDTLKQKPEHVRHRVAFGAAAGITALVAMVWIVNHAVSGTFALSSPDVVTDDDTSALTQTKGTFSDLLGAARGAGASSSQPELTIVDGNTTSTLTPSPAPQNQTNETVIPF